MALVRRLPVGGRVLGVRWDHNRDIHGLLWAIFAGLLDAEIGPGDAVHAITAPPGDRPFSILGEGAGSTHGLMRG